MNNRQLNEDAILDIARDILDSGTRTRYLDQICAGDQSLRGRVEALLAVHGQENGRPESIKCLDTTESREATTEVAGYRIGHYRLLQKIGEGGFGMVYMAEQTRPIRRMVAIKVIKPGMDTSAVVARFEAERQALALMDHPHIARVYDGGTTDAGRPYFVMELVKGVPLTEYCDHHRLTAVDRLQLFSTVCDAVQHAHHKGVIHRDLKPSNILVALHGKDPVVKVIDFGVAKAINQQLTEKTLFTAIGQMVGTPQYMSPEQAETGGLDVDTRSDVYSLGVLLYELLTGTTPLNSNRLRLVGLIETQRLIREEEPPSPSTRLSNSDVDLMAIAQRRAVSPEKLRQLILGDLDWIVMKALEKDRTRRYDSPNSIAEDVGRFLNDEPVQARPPNPWYRARKYVRRNRYAVTVVGVLLVSLAVGVLGTALQARTVYNALVRENEALLALEHQTYLGLFESALTGNDISDDLASLKDGLTSAHQLVLKGVIARNNGMMLAASDCFREAANSDNKSLYIQALALHLLIMTGDEEEYRRKLSEIEGIAPVSYEDKMFLGHVLTYSDPRRGVTLVREAIAERNSLFAQECLAELSSHVALNENDLEAAIGALEIARAINVLEPDRPEFQMILLWTSQLRIQMERLRGIDTSELESEARTIALRLGQYKEYAMGHMGAANFFELVGEEQRAEAELEAANKSGHGFYVIPFASVKFRRGEIDQALRLFKEGSNDSLFGRIVYAEALVINQPHEAAKQYEEIKAARPPSNSEKNQWIIPESIWLAAGDLERARVFCQERLRNGNYVADWEQAWLDFVVSEDSSAAMQTCLARVNPDEKPSQLQLSAAYKLAGMKYYAEGNIDKAIQYLRAARQETAVFFWPLAYWSDALARHLERKQQASVPDTQ